MKTVLKIAGGLVGVVVVAIVVFYVGWLRAPSPESVCEHMSELAKKELGVSMPPDAEKDCIRKAQPPEYGKLSYAKRMKCMQGASSIAALEPCDKL